MIVSLKEKPKKENAVEKIKKPVVMELNVDEFTVKTKLKGNIQTFGQQRFSKVYDALWNYIFLDYKRKDNLIKVYIYNAENNEQCFIYLTAAELMMHMIFWKPYVIYAHLLKRKVQIKSDTLYNLDPFNKRKMNKILKNIANYFIEDAQERENGINELSYILSLSVDDYCELMNGYCGIASNTISIYDIHQLEKRNKDFKECVYTQLDESLPLKTIEEQIKKGGRKTYNAIMNDGKSSLVNFIRGDRLNKDQFTQMFYAVGLRTDVDKTILPKLIRGNFLQGYQIPSDAYMDAITGRDAQILKHITVRDSGYLSRKIGLSNSDTRIDYSINDCGTKHTLAYHIATQDHLDSVDLKYMVLPSGKLHLIRAEKDTHLIGQTIQLRSHICCTCKRGTVCMTCFGGKAKRLRGTNIGGLPAIGLANPISKRLMRAKHFTTANSIDIKSEYMNKYFNIEEGSKLFFKPEYKTKETFICIDRDIIEDLLNGATDFSDESLDSTQPIESIIVQDGEDRYTIECEGMFLVLTSEVLEDKDKFIMEYDSDEVMIPVYKIDKDTPIFNMIVVSEAVQLYLKQIKRIIDSSKTKNYESISSLVKDISDILIEMGIAGTSIINIETLVYQLVRNPEKVYERPDFSNANPEITHLPISSSISNKDIYTAFGFERLKAQITNIDTFKKTDTGIFDPLFRTTKPAYLKPIDKATIIEALSK